MSEKKKTLKPLPFPTMKRPEYVSNSQPKAKMQGSGVEQMHLWLRESERELLYEILSTLFPDPDNQPDWFASHIPFALIVAGGYAPQSFSAEAGHLAGNFPYGFSRLTMCLFYNRYMVPRMEGKMSPRYLPPECLSEKERKIRDFSIQTLIKICSDDGPNAVSQCNDLQESNKKLAAQLNEAGAREVDGRRFSASSASRFRGRHLLDVQGSSTDYDRFCPEEWKKLSLEDWATQYDVSKAIPSSNEELASQLSAEVAEIKEVVEETDEAEDKEAKNMKKPNGFEATDKSGIKSQVKKGTTKKEDKSTSKAKVKAQKRLDEETERKIELLMELYPDPLAEEPFTQEETYAKLQEKGLHVSSESRTGRRRRQDYWRHLPAEYDQLYSKYAIPRLAKNISEETIVKKCFDSLQRILPHLDALRTYGLLPKSEEPNWSEMSRELSSHQAISPLGCIFKPSLVKEFFYQYYLPHIQEEAAKQREKAVVKVKKGKKVSAVPKAEPKSREVDKELVENAVAFINEKANEALYKYSIEIGNYILEKFFGGDSAAASSRNPRKFASYRALCKHPDLGPSAGALSIMLRVASQEKLFESNKLPVGKLSYSHKAELVKVYDDKTKVELFKEAVKKSLTVRQLQDRVREKKGLVSLSQLSQGRDGSVRRFNFEALLKTRALSDPEALKALPEKRRNELKERVEGAYAILARLLDEYGRLKDLFVTLEK